MAAPGTEGTTDPSSSLTILVVEDDRSIVQLMDLHLKDAGYVMQTAGTVGEAWRSVIDDPPDAILCDVCLPGAYGWELVERCRNDQRFHRLPIIMMSGHFDAQDISRAKTLGAGIQPKPFNGPEPIEMIGKMLSRSQKVQLLHSRVVFYLPTYKVEGTIHLPQQHPRFSDGWAAILSDSRQMIPVTDASVMTLTDEVLSKEAFLQVSKSQIQLVVPLDINERKVS